MGQRALGGYVGWHPRVVLNLRQGRHVMSQNGKYCYGEAWSKGVGQDLGELEKSPFPCWDIRPHNSRTSDGMDSDHEEMEFPGRIKMGRRRGLELEPLTMGLALM